MKPEILYRLSNLLLEKLGKTVDEEKYSDHLLGTGINMASRDLLYLFFFIQKEFNIEIDKKYILNGSFSTINNIVDIIYETLKAKDASLVM